MSSGHTPAAYFTQQRPDLTWRSASMEIVHGTWIPDDTDDFVQRGAFYIWVETDTVLDLHAGALQQHPRHLTRAALDTFLSDRLGLGKTSPGTLAGEFLMKHFVLPSVNGRPLPSFEMLP